MADSLKMKRQSIRLQQAPASQAKRNGLRVPQQASGIENGNEMPAVSRSALSCPSQDALGSFPLEHAKIWSHASLPGIELLSASYTRFSFAKHWHDELAIGVIEDGAEGLLYRGQNVLVPKRHIVAINPGEVHTGFAGTPHGWRYRMFYFRLDELDQHFAGQDRAFNPVIDRPVIDDEALFATLLELHVSLELPAFDLTRQSLHTMALTQLFGRYGTLARSEPGGVDQRGALLARDFIHAHFDTNPSLAALESVSACSRFQLIKSFKTLFGVTPHQYLLLTKIRHAKRLLAEGKRCIDVSLACGFYDQSHFIRNFKRACGVSPANYRTRH
ncbi:AraC family transcriptional regulator [Chitinibacteraceae bacterium HSL-7]